MTRPFCSQLQQHSSRYTGNRTHAPWVIKCWPEFWQRLQLQVGSPLLCRTNMCPATEREQIEVLEGKRHTGNEAM